MIIISIIGIILNTLVNIWSGSKPFNQNAFLY